MNDDQRVRRVGRWSTQCTNRNTQVRRSDMFTLRSRRLLTKLLGRNEHGLAFLHQVNDPLLSQQQVRGITNKSLFQFQPTGVMDPDVAKVLPMQ